MLRMVSHPRRPQSGHLTCYLNRTYHVLPTKQRRLLDAPIGERDNGVHVSPARSRPATPPFGQNPSPVQAART